MSKLKECIPVAILIGAAVYVAIIAWLLWPEIKAALIHG